MIGNRSKSFLKQQWTHSWDVSVSSIHGTYGAITNLEWTGPQKLQWQSWPLRCIQVGPGTGATTAEPCSARFLHLATLADVLAAVDLDKSKGRFQGFRLLEAPELQRLGWTGTLPVFKENRASTLVDEGMRPRGGAHVRSFVCSLCKPHCCVLRIPKVATGIHTGNARLFCLGFCLHCCSRDKPDNCFGPLPYGCYPGTSSVLRMGNSVDRVDGHYETIRTKPGTTARASHSHHHTANMPFELRASGVFSQFAACFTSKAQMRVSGYPSKNERNRQRKDMAEEEVPPRVPAIPPATLREAMAFVSARPRGSVIFACASWEYRETAVALPGMGDGIFEVVKLGRRPHNMSVRQIRRAIWDDGCAKLHQMNEWWRVALSSVSEHNRKLQEQFRRGRGSLQMRDVLAHFSVTWARPMPPALAGIQFVSGSWVCRCGNCDSFVGCDRDQNVYRVLCAGS